MPESSQQVSPYFGARDRPVFIGGAPRSGTTLLRTMLNCHPELGIPRETKVVLYGWEQRGRWGDLSNQANLDSLAEWVATRERPSSVRFGVRLAEIRKKVAAAPPTLGSALGTCLATYAERSGKPRWVDKRPVYARYLDAVFAMFPDAQFVNLVRDPRASVASMRQIGWWNGRFIPALELWQRSVSALDPWRTVLAPDQMLDVRYEDFVNDPATMLKRVVDFLGLPPDGIPAMLDYQSHVDETSPVHPRLREPVTAATTESWTTVLSPAEAAYVEKIAGDQMMKLGYDLRFQGVAFDDDSPAIYTARQRRMARFRRQARWREFKHLVRYHHPVAARLTSSQLAEPAAPQMPGFWQRTSGRPL